MSVFLTFSAELKSCRATTGLMAKAVKLQHPFVHAGTQTQGSRKPAMGASLECVCARLNQCCSIKGTSASATLVAANGNQMAHNHTNGSQNKYLGVLGKGFENNSVYVEMKSNIAKGSCY